jgi:hypothetical protein
LKGEAWIDRERADAVDPRIGQAIDNGEMLEISTGLATEKAGNGGTFNGREYDAIAVNHKPDHLAILLDNQGACSIRDGCGLLTNQRTSPMCNYMPDLPLPNMFPPEVSTHAGPCVTTNDDVRLAQIAGLIAKLFGESAYPMDVWRNAVIFSSGTDLYAIAIGEIDDDGRILSLSGDPVRVLQAGDSYSFPLPDPNDQLDSGETVSADNPDDPEVPSDVERVNYGRSAAGSGAGTATFRQRQSSEPKTTVDKTGWREQWSNDGAALRRNRYASTVLSMEPETMLPTTMQASHPDFVVVPIWNPILQRFAMRELDRVTANQLSQPMAELPLPPSTCPPEYVPRPRRENIHK